MFDEVSRAKTSEPALFLSYGGMSEALSSGRSSIGSVMRRGHFGLSFVLLT